MPPSRGTGAASPTAAEHPTQALLDDLAAAAGEHAANRLAAEQLSDAAVEAWIRDHPAAFEAWIKVHAKPAPQRRPAARAKP